MKPGATFESVQKAALAEIEKKPRLNTSLWGQRAGMAKARVCGSDEDEISQRVDHGHRRSKVASKGAMRALQNVSAAQERRLDLSRSGGAWARPAGTCACGPVGKGLFYHVHLV